MHMFLAANASYPPLLGIVSIVVFIAVYIWIVKLLIDDLYKPERRVAGGNKDLWALIIVVFSVVGIMVYLLYGREKE